MDISLEDVMASWAQLEKDVGHTIDRLFGHNGTPAAALKGSHSEDVVALSAMVVDQSCRSSTSPSSAWSKGDADSLTAAGTNADDVPDAIVRIFKSTPRGIKKDYGRGSKISLQQLNEKIKGSCRLILLPLP
eukprot:gene14637-14781_t